MTATFAVGIDLGTTNTVVAGARLDGDGAASVFEVPQLVTASEASARPLFPSMLYAPLEGEAIADPYGDAPWALGEIARRRDAEVPGRVIASSKSWLAYAAVERTAPILPWGAAEGAPRTSPVDAAARLLGHVRRAWDAAHPDAPLAAQDVVLTVPASFDEVARELSVQAAAQAGLSPKLLEEPQAAFYDWMSRVGRPGVDRLLEAAGGPALVLVVDVGGGTTDLSLMRVSAADRVARVAVGPHVLLGGDNMDLALAHACEARLSNGAEALDPARFSQLVAACRSAKEALLGEHPPDDAPVTVLAAGASLVGAARTTRLGRQEVERVVLDGFFPEVAADARPSRTRGALVTLGLPYERDVAITRHIAAFLGKHLPPGEQPHAVLLNGGVFRAAQVSERICAVLSAWRGSSVLRLPHADPDLAVARGAVAYARARAGAGVRIGGGAARGYFVGVGGEGASHRAVCVVPRGADEGVVHSAEGRTFALSVGRPVRFDLYASDASDARPGDVVDVEDDRYDRLPPLSTTLSATDAPGGTGVPAPAAHASDVPVTLQGELTPIGTVELACVEVGVARPRRFRLAFALRGDASSTRRESTLPPPSQDKRMRGAVDLLEGAFGKPRSAATGREAKDLLRDLERAICPRDDWSVEVARALFDALAARDRGRRRSADHERVFWLLAGWTIRPGFGHPLDPERVRRLASWFDERLGFPSEARGWQQLWIAARRAAGGLDEAVQTRIRDFVDPYLAPPGASKRPKKPAASLDDALDMASSLERVAPPRRSELGGWILERTWTDRDPRLWTAIGRLGARAPAYASVHHVVSPAVAERWLDHLLREKWDAVPTAVPAAVQLARRTGDRARDVSERVRRDVESRLVACGAPGDLVTLVRDVVPGVARERAAFFGDALPAGLTLVA